MVALTAETSQMTTNEETDDSSLTRRPPKAKKSKVDPKIVNDEREGDDEGSLSGDVRCEDTNVWKDTSGSLDNAWKWRHPQWGEFYNEEESCKWTDKDFLEEKYHDDDDQEAILRSVSTTFFMDDAYEDADDFDWETHAPPLPSAIMQHQMQQVHEKALSGDLVRRIAQAFWDDWNGKFAHGGGSWWSGKKDADVKESFDEADVPLPQNVDELEKLISLSGFMIWEAPTPRYNRNKLAFFVWVDFDVGEQIMEEEHGLGAQFNGETWECVGLSYSQAAS